MKVYDVDWAALALQEMQERGIEAPDREPDFNRWKHDPVAFIDELKLCGGPLDDKQKEILATVIQWPEALVYEQRRPAIIDAVVSKTRQVGMSWLFMATEFWLVTFWGGFRILNAHRNFTEVDDGGGNSSVRSLHGRIRWMHTHGIPGWLRTRAPLSFKEGMIQNNSGSFIVGQGAVPDLGRGMTLDMAFLDEFAHMEWSRLIWASITQACKRGKIANSTPKGRGNEYYRLVCDHHKRRLTRIDYHWSECPRMNVGMHIAGEDPTCDDCMKNTHYAGVGNLTSPWYEEQSDILGADDLIAQELDQSFDRSQSGRVYPEASRPVHMVAADRNPATPLFCAWDFGYSGATVLILAQIENYGDLVEIQVLAYHENSGQIIDDYVPIVHEWESLYGDIRHVGDPAGLARNIETGRGVIDALADHGIYVESPHWLHSDAKEGIRLTRVALRGARGMPNAPHVRVRINPLAERLMDCLENTHYPLDKNGTRVEGKEMPADDEFTHGSDAFRYLIHYVCRTLLHNGAQVDEELEVKGLYLGGVLDKDF